MKRVGLITLHKWFNYGSMLQSYAMNKTLNKIGFDCELIDFTPPQIDNKRSYGLYNDIPENEELRKLYASEIINRKNNFEKFMHLYKCSNNKYHSDEEIMNDPPSYDAYVTGSDQIWNVNMRIASKAYFLFFTQSEEKYAFATSIGRCKEDKLEDYGEYIRLYKKIFIREEEGANLISKIAPKCEVSTMIDPTLLLTKEEWNELLPIERLIDQTYIVCYATLDDELKNMMPILEKIHEYTNKKIVLFGMVTPRRESWITNVVDAGPIEFIRLIRDADLVITHSYHGTVFSINFNKNFITYNDEFENPRKEGILRQLGLTNRIIHKADDLNSILNSTIMYNNVNTILYEERAKGLEQIKINLGS